MHSIVALFGAYDNLHDPPEFFNHTTNILGVTIACMIITWACALLRLYVRLFVIHAPGWDDFFVTVSLLSTTAGTVSLCVATTHAGMGQHFLLIGAVKQLRYLKIFYVANATYPLSAGGVKLALLFQYLRAYDKTSRLRKWIIGCLVVVAAWTLAFGFLAWVPCIPVPAYWDLTVPTRARYAFGSLYVEPFVTTYTSLTTTNMILDLAILGLAAPLLLYGQPKSKRWALVSLFCVGSIASILSIWRLASIVRTRATTYPTFDPTWYGPTPITLAALEVDVAVISAALPVFWPVLRHLQLRILVTREVEVTMEQRRLKGKAGAPPPRTSNDDDDDDDAIELHRSESGLQPQGSDRDQDYYQDPYVQQQVDPLSKAEFGTTSQVGVMPLQVERKASFGKGLRKYSIGSKS